VFPVGVGRVLSHCAPSDGRTVPISGVSYTPPIESESIPTKIVTDLPDRPRSRSAKHHGCSGRSLGQPDQLYGVHLPGIGGGAAYPVGCGGPDSRECLFVNQ
jgi:hypothetical protein